MGIPIKKGVAKPERRKSAEVMNLEEVAAFLGVATATIKRLIEEEGFPCRKVGERYLFGLRAVVGWVNFDAPPR
ncbi:MAG: helix-turn-helix domain-containing protein [Thermoguttaceae bacterium]|nr:helix-turn-helix domain-containing protein [Thermoguttaceae bacterium]